VLSNLGAPPTGLTNLFLKLGTRDCPLTTALRNQFPESGIATEFQLFRIKALDTNNQSKEFLNAADSAVSALSFGNIFPFDELHFCQF
jgi:hypothetical protein